MMYLERAVARDKDGITIVCKVAVLEDDERVVQMMIKKKKKKKQKKQKKKVQQGRTLLL